MRTVELLAWVICLVWTINVCLCLRGGWVHAIRALHGRSKLQELIDKNIDGALRYAAILQVTGEWVRLGIKMLFFAIACLRLSEAVEDLALHIYRLDGRDLFTALLTCGILSLLTWWSEWEYAQKPAVLKGGAHDAVHS